MRIDGAVCAEKVHLVSVGLNFCTALLDDADIKFRDISDSDTPHQNNMRRQIRSLEEDLVLIRETMVPQRLDLEHFGLLGIAAGPGTPSLAEREDGIKFQVHQLRKQFRDLEDMVLAYLKSLVDRRTTIKVPKVWLY